MPSKATTQSTKAVARYADLQIANHSAFIGVVSSVNTTSITLTDTTGMTGKTLYAASSPGMVVIVDGTAGTDVGKVANITGVTGDVLTVSVDLSTALSAGKLVAVIPPMASRISTNGGHTLQAQRTKDESIGLGDSVLTHNTALQVDVNGSIPFYLSRDSQAVARLILAGTGLYKKSASGTHKFRPQQVNDASSTFAEAKDFAVFSKDGDSVVNQAFLGLFGTQLDLNFPNQGVANGALTVLGAHAVREVGGTGKAFTTGANNWNRPATERDAGNRHNFSGVFAEFGGSFGAALTTSSDRFVLEANVRVTRNPANDYALGGQDRVVPVEDTFGIEVTGRRILENDNVYQDFFGTSADATPGQQTLTRLLLAAVHPGDTTKTLNIDIPNGVWKVDEVQRQRGRFVESFTFQGIQKLASGAYDAATPLYEITYVNGDDVDLLSAL